MRSIFLVDAYILDTHFKWMHFVFATSSDQLECVKESDCFPYSFSHNALCELQLDP